MKAKQKWILRSILTAIIVCVGLCVFSVISLNADAAGSDKGDRIIVALGDSYSSGEGIDPFFAHNTPISERVENQDWLCHRSQNAWSGMLTLKDKDGKTITMKDHRGDADTPGNWYFAAMSGAVTANILETDNLPTNLTYKQKMSEKYRHRFKKYHKTPDINVNIWNTEYDYLDGIVEITPQLKIFDLLGNRYADYVTVTLGGNDAKFADVVKDAALGFSYINPHLNQRLRKRLSDVMETSNLNNIMNNLEDSYTAIDKASKQKAHIIVAGYPMILYGRNVGVVFNLDEITMINNCTAVFNLRIKSTVEKCKEKGINIHYVDVLEAFLDEETKYIGGLISNACINGICLRKEQDIDESEIISAYSMHPNEKGAAIYAKCVQAKIDELEETTTVSGTVKDQKNKPVNGVTVTLTDQYGRSYGTAVTKNGSYKIKTWHDSECEYSVTFEKKGYDTKTEGTKKGALKLQFDTTLQRNSEYDKLLKEEMYQAYQSVIKAQLVKFGKCRVQDDNFTPTTYCLGGLGVVRLIDFDKDGQDELVTIGYQEDHSHAPRYILSIYTFDGEKAVNVYSDCLCRDIHPSDFIGKVSCLGFNYYDAGDSYRILTQNKQLSYYDLEWSELQQGKIISVQTISQLFNTTTQQFDYKINGNIVSESEFNKTADELKKKTIDIQCSGSSSTTMQSVLNETESVLQRIGYTMNTSEERYRAYREKVEELIAKYGKPFINNNAYGGTAIVKLIDFDDDGNEELYCAYSEKIGWVDQQEIFEFENGKAVSLFKGDINNMGTGVAPYVLIRTNGSQFYIKSGCKDKEGGSPGYDVSVENGRKVVDTSNNIQWNNHSSAYINISVAESPNILKDTEAVMRQIGCKDYNIIDIVAYGRQKMVYQSYLDSGKWKNNNIDRDTPHSSVGINDIKKQIYFDFDGDGILEMWMKISAEHSAWPDTLSVFCTIKNGEVVELIKAEEGGGEIGGDYVTLVYSKKDDQFYIGNFGHSRGFGGVYGALTTYTMIDGILEKVAEYSAMSLNQGMGESKYTINGQVVTAEEESAFASNYHKLDFDTAEKTLYYFSPAISIKERLKTLKVIA